MKKKFQYDGKSRPVTDLYTKNFDRIFGKKIKKDEEVEGYYIDGYDPKNSKLLVKKKS